MHQPLNPPSTSVGGPRLPAAVVADQESWKPSPSTSQQPFGQLVDGDLPAEAAGRRHGGGRSGRGPGGGRGRRRGGGARQDDAVDLQPGLGARCGGDAVRAGGQRELAWRRTASAVTASPASSVGDRGLDPHREGLAVDADQVVAAAGVELGRDGGRRAERRARRWPPAAAPARRSGGRWSSGVDGRDLDLDRTGRQRRREA